MKREREFITLPVWTETEPDPSRRIPLLFSWATAPYLKSLVTGNQNQPKPTWGVEKSQKLKSSNLYQVPFLWFWRLGCLAPIQVPKKKLKSKQNQKSYQHFHHFTIPGKFIWYSPGVYYRVYGIPPEVVLAKPTKPAKSKVDNPVQSTGPGSP